MSAVDAHVVLVSAGWGEDGSRQDADVFGQSRLIELQRVDLARQLHPQYITASRKADASAFWQIFPSVLPDLFYLGSKSSAQSLQVPVIAAGFKEFRKHMLLQRRGGESSEQLKPLNLRAKATSGDPANAIARHEHLRKRRAQNHRSIFVERLRGPWTGLGKRQIRVDVVLDQDDPATRGQLHQSLLVFVPHYEAQRVMAIRHGDAHLDAVFADAPFQLAQIHSLLGVCRDLDHLHSEGGGDPDDPEIGGTLYRDHVARPRHRPQAEIDRIGGSRGYGYVTRSKGAAHAGGTSCNLAA